MRRCIVFTVLPIIIIMITAAPALYAQKQSGGSKSKSGHKAAKLASRSSSKADGFAISVRFRDANGVQVGGDVKFGVNIAATNCVDAALGESFLPPLPPRGLPDIRFMNPRDKNDTCYDLGINNDFRPYHSPAQADTFLLQFQFGPESYPMKLAWGLLKKYYAGPVTLKDPYDGKMIHVNMLKDTSATIPPRLPSVYIIASHPVVGK